MPVIGLKDSSESGMGAVIPLDEAVRYFDDQGLFPADVVAAWVKDFKERSSRQPGEFISPSVISPSTTCRRQVFIERFFKYVVDPYSLWSAMEGTLYHNGINRLGAEANLVPGAEREIRYPNESFASHPAVKVCEGSLKVEVFPGVFMAGVVDLFELELRKITDYKTQRATSADYSAKNAVEWQPQINIYAYLIEILRELEVRELWVWRTFRGAYDANTANRKIPIAKVERDELWGALKGWVMELLEWLKRGNAVYQEALVKGEDPDEKLKAIVAEMPMEGETMFVVHKGKNAGGNKCTLWCGAKDICFGVAGRMVF